VLVELKGGNDGLNTLVPIDDPATRDCGRRLAIGRDSAVRLTDRAALHPSLAPLVPLWERRQLAILQGVGYPDPNLSHFRSIEIWETASRSDQVLADGWLARAFGKRPVPASFAADGVVIGGNDLGPLAAAARARSRSPIPSSSCAARSSPRRGRAPQRRARAHPEDRGRHRAGGRAPRRQPTRSRRRSRRARSATR
jgi:uncharacterized protein (DUF1501 family)